MTHPGPDTAEMVFLAEVLQHEGFAACYMAERLNLGAIRWEVDPRILAPGQQGGCLIRDGRPPLIRLSYAPYLDEPWVCMHEFLHLVMFRRGFPTLYAAPEQHTLASMLATVLHDLVVVEEMRRYGFDAITEYRLSADQRMRALFEDPPFRSDAEGLLIGALLYAEAVLEQDCLANWHEHPDDRAAFLWSMLHPDMAERGMQLVDEARRTGWQTPARMRLVLESVVSAWGLTATIKVI